MKKEKPIFSIGLYTLSAVLLIYAVWSFVHGYNYISEMIRNGQLVSAESKYEIINFYMSNCAQYVLFAVAFIALGRMMMKQAPTTIVNQIKSEVSSEDEDDLIEWLEEIKSSQAKETD